MQESVNEQRPKKIFADAKEVEITRAIAAEFYSVLQDRAECDVIIIGAGPAGLTAARELSLMGYKILVIEQNNYQAIYNLIIHYVGQNSYCHKFISVV